MSDSEIIKKFHTLVEMFNANGLILESKNGLHVTIEFKNEVTTHYFGNVSDAANFIAGYNYAIRRDAECKNE